MQIALLALLLINALGLLLMRIDKEKARRHRWRISEATLFTVALLGGSAGVLLGMYAFRHKTKHRRFTIGVPVILLAQLGLAGYLLLMRSLVPPPGRGGVFLPPGRRRSP